MRTRITSEQRHQIIQLLSKGYARDKIATIVGVSSGQVAAIAAHVTMGTYALDVNTRDVQPTPTWRSVRHPYWIRLTGVFRTRINHFRIKKVTMRRRLFRPSP